MTGNVASATTHHGFVTRLVEVSPESSAETDSATFEHPPVWPGACQMTLKERIADRGRRVLSNPLVLKWSTDDHIKRAAESVLDMRSRAQEAWRILVNGHALRAVDPALDDSIGQTEEQFIRSRVTQRHPDKSNGKGIVHALDTQGSDDMDESLKERGTIASIGGRDVLQKCFQFKAADNARKMGIYPYFRPLDFNDGPEAQINGKRVTMLGSITTLA